MTDDEWVPTGVDASIPSVARVYDFMLGGKDNFEADRKIGNAMIEMFPMAQEAVLANRRFLVRAVRRLAESGVRQFLDIGTGLPTQDNVHQVAGRHIDNARTVYVDKDPIVLAHARALLADSTAVIVQEDLRNPKAILQNPIITGNLDFTEPVALLLVAVLPFISDEDDPYGLVRTLLAALPSGSYLVLSHGTADAHPEEADATRRMYEQGGVPLRLRSKAAVEAFFDGLEVVEPGVVWAKDWYPELGDPDQMGIYVGVARKP